MVFKYHISFAIDLAANFGCYHLIQNMPDIVSKLCVLPSEVAGLFNSSPNRHPFLRQSVHLDLLLCTGFHSEHAALFLCHIFTQWPMND